MRSTPSVISSAPSVAPSARARRPSFTTRSRTPDQLPDVVGALVDAQPRDVAVVSLDGMAVAVAAAAQQEHGLVGGALRGLGGEELGHRGPARHVALAAVGGLGGLRD